MNNHFEMIPIGEIVPSKTNPRKNFNDAELQDLAASIKSVGLINPITVREIPWDSRPVKKDVYEIVAGEKRWRACKIADLKEMPALIKDLTDDQVLEIQIIENLQRSDVHPMDESNGYQALIKSKKYTPETIADKVGKPLSYIYNRLKLQDLIPDAQKYFIDGDLLIGHALLLCKLQKNDQQNVLKHISNTGDDKKIYFDSVRDLKEHIERNILLDLHKASFQKDDSVLVKKAGPCTECSKRTGHNKMLFDEIGNNDFCTDPACFKSKQEAHFKLKVAELETNNVKMKKITNNWYSGDKEILSRDSGYHVITNKKDRCDYQIKGIYVDEGIMKGIVVDICISTSCTKHHKQSSYSSSTSTKKSPDERYFRKLEIIHQPEAQKEIIEAAKEIYSLYCPMEKEYQLIIAQFLHKLDGSTRNFILTQVFDLKGDFYHSTTYDDNKHMRNNKILTEYLSKLSLRELQKMLFVISLLSDITTNLEYLSKSSEYKWFIEFVNSYFDMDKIKQKIAPEFDALRDKVKKSFIRINGYDPDEKKETKKGKNKKNKNEVES